MDQRLTQLFEAYTAALIEDLKNPEARTGALYNHTLELIKYFKVGNPEDLPGLSGIQEELEEATNTLPDLD